MESNVFLPHVQKVRKDSLSTFFCSMALGVLILAFGLLPLLFVPDTSVSLNFTKIYLVTLGIFAALILIILSILRKGMVSLFLPPALGLFWAFTLVAFASGLLSGDRLDTLTGTSMEIHTAGFMLLLALVMSIALFIGSVKAAVVRLFVVLGISTILLQLFHLSRLVFGPEFLSFGALFTSPTSSPIGSFNDLAIFSGLALLVVMVLLQQVTASRVGKWVSAIVVISSLLLLMVINFYLVWLVVGFVSLITALYLIVKDTWLKGGSNETVMISRFAISLIGLVCIVSGAFLVSGDYLGGVVNRITNINYIEVRPSLTATIDLTKAVYANDALFGVGPNRFEDAWRSHKDPIINQTIFWNTNFTSGSGYLPTLFVTTGLTGGLFFLIFLGTFLYHGYRSLFVSEARDSSWFLIGLVSFISATYLWFMTVVYVPGATLMILASLFTGITLVATLKMRQQPGFVIDVTASKRHGIALMAVILIVCASSVYLLRDLSKQYTANLVYAAAVEEFRSGAGFDTTETALTKAQNLNPQDLYVAERAELRLAEINRINNLEVTEENQQYFTRLLSEGIALAEEAIAIDNTNPNNYILLINFYSLLDPSQFEGLAQQIEDMFSRVRELDPQNPLHLVLLSQHKARQNQFDETRRLLLEAVALKRDYTDALYLLSQLDIQEGNIDSALAFTRSIISIEPNNPTRYFQLGLLLAADQQLEPAAKAFETAISLGGTYANARYFLALTYLDLGRTEEALSQLRLVLETNENNELVSSLISQIESGTYVRPENQAAIPVTEEQRVSQSGDVTTTNAVPDSGVVTTLNQPGSSAAENGTNTTTSSSETQTDTADTGEVEAETE